VDPPNTPPIPSPRTNIMNCLVLLLPCLAYTGNNKVGPGGMQHLSDAVETNESLTSLHIGSTLGGNSSWEAGREGSDKKMQGLCVGERYKAVWALVWICGSAQSGRSFCVHGHSASGGQVCRCQGWVVVHRRRLCMVGYVYTALSVWWRGGCVKFWVAVY
jgi:hypothetical protein